MCNKDTQKKLNACKELVNSLHGCLGTKDEIEGCTIFCPEYGIEIKPVPDTTEPDRAIFDFYLYSDEFDEPLYECCAAGDVGMAGGIFLMSFWEGIKSMKTDKDPVPLETELDKKPHRWKLYKSPIVSMGEMNASGFPDDYYLDLLKDGIMKRLGNRKLCYVKVYAMRSQDRIIGEVRVNDVHSPELSDIMAKVAEKWEVNGFASHKQFFFIKQDEETALPDRYAGEEGRKELKAKVKTAAEMFHASVRDENLYNSYPERLAETLGDKTLAWECFLFLPEICAERAFSRLVFNEQIYLVRGDKNVMMEGFYKTQLSDYYPLQNALFSLFDEGAFGDDDAINTIFGEYVGVSSTAKAVNAAKQNNQPPESIRGMAQLFHTDKDFEIR